MPHPVADLTSPPRIPTLTDIEGGMEIVSECGCFLGIVEHIDNETITLFHDHGIRFIPTSWVAFVDQDVHLNRNVFDVKDNWLEEDDF